jgi:dienelactone hydrolase
MLSRRFGLIGSVAVLISSDARAGERLIGGVPLPNDVAVQPMPNGVSTSAGSFSGAWIGSWGGFLRHLLIVEAVHPDQTAQVLYAIGDAPAGPTRRMWMRRRATIAGTMLTIEGRATITYMLEPSGSLLATYRQDTLPSYARMSRIPLQALTGSETGLDWGEPTTVFLDGPAENGAPARLETVLFRPQGRGPFPLLVFNHGSTGSGRDPALFTRTYWNFGLADFLLSQGWMVAFPQRRGRGRSEGLYDEGFSPDRSQGYTCDAATSLRGADRALADVRTAIAALRRRADVARVPILIGGVSRGGALAIAFAGRHPETAGGVLNFAGGWIGTGCSTATEINGTLFRDGGRYRRPTLWLYGTGDRFYSIEHSRSNFDLFRQSGGVGQFLVFDVPGGEGHAVASYRELWLEPMRTYLASVGQAPPR